MFQYKEAREKQGILLPIKYWLTDKKPKTFLIIKQTFKLQLRMTPAAKIRELNVSKLQHINIMYGLHDF